jgi:uncharacterized membrane protein YdjX (TVP38/TMEM64 family)
MNSLIKNLAVVIGVCVIFIILFRLTGLHEIITLENLKAHRDLLQDVVTRNWWPSFCVYSLILSAAVVLTVPATGPLFAGAGFLFGFIPAFFISLIGMSLGLIGSYILFSTVLSRFVPKDNKKIERLKCNINKYGYSYLITLNLMTVFPFFIILFVAVAAQVPLIHTLWTCVLGSSPIIAIYIFAGTQLGTVNTFSELFSWHIVAVLITLIVLSLLPMYLQRRKAINHEQSGVNRK